MKLWKKIPNWGDRYEVSNHGEIRSNYRNQNSILMPYDNRYGYLLVTLCGQGMSKKLFVHRLVAEVFLPNPNNLPQVNHKNGNKSDNRVENLEWLSRSDNQLHSYRVLGRKSVPPCLKGEQCGLSKLTTQKVLNIRSEYAVGNITRQKLADKYGVTIHTIKSIIGRHTWKHI